MRHVCFCMADAQPGCVVHVFVASYSRLRLIERAPIKELQNGKERLFLLSILALLVRILAAVVRYVLGVIVKHHTDQEIEVVALL